MRRLACPVEPTRQASGSSQPYQIYLQCIRKKMRAPTKTLQYSAVQVSIYRMIDRERREERSIALTLVFARCCIYPLPVSFDWSFPVSGSWQVQSSHLPCGDSPGTIPAPIVKSASSMEQCDLRSWSLLCSRRIARYEGKCHFLSFGSLFCCPFLEICQDWEVEGSIYKREREWTSPSSSLPRSLALWESKSID